jgi:hypothetical protein
LHLIRISPSNELMNRRTKGKPDDAAKSSSAKRNTRSQSKGRSHVRAAQDAQASQSQQEVAAPKRPSFPEFETTGPTPSANPERERPAPSAKSKTQRHRHDVAPARAPKKSVFADAMAMPVATVDRGLAAAHAWQIYLAEVSEEGVALIGDQDAKELARRCFRLAEVFLEECARRS